MTVYVDGAIPAIMHVTEGEYSIVEFSDGKLEKVTNDRITLDIDSTRTIGVFKVPMPHQPKIGERYWKIPLIGARPVQCTYNDSILDKNFVRYGCAFKSEIDAIAYQNALEFHAKMCE